MSLGTVLIIIWILHINNKVLKGQTTWGKEILEWILGCLAIFLIIVIIAYWESILEFLFMVALYLIVVACVGIFKK